MWDFSDIYKKDQFAVSYLTLHEWNYKKLKGKRLSDFLTKNGYNSAALYSMGTLGITFLEELHKEGFSVPFVIDKNKNNLPPSIQSVPVVGLDGLHMQTMVDAVIVCHVYYYNAIADELIRSGIPENKILSLNDIVFSL